MTLPTWTALRSEFDELEAENERLRTAFDRLFEGVCRTERDLLAAQQASFDQNNHFARRLGELAERYRLDRFKL